MISSFFNQSITHTPRGGFNADGSTTVTTPTTVSCRFQPMQKQRILPNNEIIIIVGIVYAPVGRTYNIGDKITYSTKDYRINAVIEAQGKSTAHHVKLELVPW